MRKLWVQHSTVTQQEHRQPGMLSHSLGGENYLLPCAPILLSSCTLTLQPHLVSCTRPIA